MMHSQSGQLLLIDDDVNLAEAIKRRLEGSGFVVSRVPTGTAGVDIATTRPIDLLLLDLNLPDMAGEEVLQLVRTQSNLPVLIISCEDDEKSRINGFDLGADGYMTKPLSLKELEAQVRAILRRSTVTSLAQTSSSDITQPHSRLKCDGVELILNERQAFVNGEEIHLSATEFQVLRYFIEHAGSAVSAQQILSSVWGYSGYDRHIVETNVYRLRKKIEDDPKQPQRLVTVRSYGYKYVKPDANRSSG